jgi:CheY-like chemotaxis protein
MGMAPETTERVFEPFFTTKPEGKGTGLGLSQVYGFVQQSGGRIAIDSLLGKGTAVRIYLPLVSAEAGSVEKVSSNPTRAYSASEAILVVEDDPDVAEIVLSILNDAGYSTYLANNSREALSLLNTAREVDLLFTDLIMPGGMNGVELARAARELRPAMKILLTSGYTAVAGVGEAATREGFPLILKPYRQHELVDIIRTVLDGRINHTPRETAA